MGLLNKIDHQHTLANRCSQWTASLRPTIECCGDHKHQHRAKNALCQLNFLCTCKLKWLLSLWFHRVFFDTPGRERARIRQLRHVLRFRSCYSFLALFLSFCDSILFFQSARTQLLLFRCSQQEQLSSIGFLVETYSKCLSFLFGFDGWMMLLKIKLINQSKVWSKF